MSDTYSVSVGNKGRVVVPVDIRNSKGWTEGTEIIAVETTSGVLLTDRAHLKELVRQQLAGTDLVGELLQARRNASVQEDAR